MIHKIFYLKIGWNSYLKNKKELISLIENTENICYDLHISSLKEIKSIIFKLELYIKEHLKYFYNLSS